jgi:hypothetical protein
MPKFLVRKVVRRNGKRIGRFVSVTARTEREAAAKFVHSGGKKKRKSRSRGGGDEFGFFDF